MQSADAVTGSCQRSITTEIADLLVVWLEITVVQWFKDLLYTVV